MAFPSDPLGLLVELYIDGSWTDVTDRSYVRNEVTVSRGRSDEGTSTDPGKCTATLNNRGGRFSPRNPSGPYYGQIGRNTPIRVSVQTGDAYLYLDGQTSDQMTTPDASGLDIVGDIDVRVDAEPYDWRTAVELCGKYETTGNQRSWSFWVTQFGRIGCSWSPDGTFASVLNGQSTESVPAIGRLAVRFTLDVNNGSGGNTVTFYTAPTINGPWTQLGDPSVLVGTTSIHSGSAPLEVGDVADLADPPITGRIYAVEVRNGINGTTVANPTLSAVTIGASSFTDAAGNTWTLVGNSEVTDRRVRFCGEVSAWPPRWDVSEEDVYTPIEAAGVMRRLTQGAKSIGSALYRGRLRSSVGLVAYWPMEDPDGSTALAPALNHPAMTIIGSPELAAFDEFAASSPIPTLNGAELRGRLPAYTVTGQTQVRCLLAVPAGGGENNEVLIALYGSGSIRRWEVLYGNTGALTLRAYNSAGTEVLSSPGAFAVNGELLMLSIELSQDGADVDYNVVTLEPGAGSGSSLSGTLSSNTVGPLDTVVISPSGGIADTAIGHVSVQTSITSIFDLADELDAWTGEAAGERIKRLCDEEGVVFQLVDGLDDTAAMGPQLPATLMELLQEAAEADGGILYELRERLGLGYTPRVNLYNQAATAALDYDEGHISPPLEPVEDDEGVRNDITLTRKGGSSARAVLEEGPLSVQSPPAGIGRYDGQDSISIENDLQLPDQAWWRLHLATVDEERYPRITVDLAANPSLADDVMALDSGHRLTIDNPPAWLPPATISQLVAGYSEQFHPYGWSIAYNCVPYSPYMVATYDDSTARYGPVDTVLDDGIDSTTTSVDIDTPTGPLWDTAESGYDVLIGGERMTVSAVGSATGTVQTLTVIRSVNGVTKSHSAGAAVVLADPAIYAL
ncbi:hypothetical protein ACWDA3_26120 [Nonomuraea rubra]